MGYIQTTVIISICVGFTTSSLLTFCENDASYCNNPNLYELGYVTFGKCNVGYVLHRIEKTNLLKCVKQCLKMANCTSINFRSPWKLCDLNSGADFQYNLVNEGGCMFSEISKWPQALAGSCAGHDCTEGYMCKGKTSDGRFECTFKYCPEAPCVQNAEVIEKFGLYRSVGRGVKYRCQTGYHMTGSPFAACSHLGSWNVMFACSVVTTGEHYKPVDCDDIVEKQSGVYRIYPIGGNGFNVYCDWSTNNEGWTVFQQRYDGSVDFYRDWLTYEQGFGCLGREFWLGNSYLSQLTGSDSYKLRVILTDTEGQSKYANYSHFRVYGPDIEYTLEISGYSGTAGDSMGLHNGKKFSTKDNDNDLHWTNCAIGYKGGWWYNACHIVNLNGLYLNGTSTRYAVGMVWEKWKGFYYSYMKTKMMIRRN